MGGAGVGVNCLGIASRVEIRVPETCLGLGVGRGGLCRDIKRFDGFFGTIGSHERFTESRGGGRVFGREQPIVAPEYRRSVWRAVGVKQATEAPRIIWIGFVDMGEP